MIFILSLNYSVRALSNGACGLLIFPADRSVEASREPAAPAQTFPASIWSVSLLLPGGVRLSLPPAALERALARLPEEGFSALLHRAEAPETPLAAAECEDARLRRLIEGAGGRLIPAEQTLELSWDLPPERVPELLAETPRAAVAVDPRGRLEGGGLRRPLPLDWAEESGLRQRFAMREPEEEHGALRFFLPPGRVAVIAGERLPPGEYVLREGGLSRLLPAAAHAFSAGAAVCLSPSWPSLSEVWDLYNLWLGSGTVRPAESAAPVWGALCALLTEDWERRLSPLHTLTAGDAAFLHRHLLRAPERASDPDRPLGRRGAQELVRRLCGLDAGSPRRPAEALALLRLGAARAFCQGGPRVVRWSEADIRRVLEALERAL